MNDFHDSTRSIIKEVSQMATHISRELVEKTYQKALTFFQEIAAIPHPSGHEEKIADYLVDFAKKRNLTYKRTEDVILDKKTHNVIIYKEGSAGRETEDLVVLQAHIDMVYQKDEGLEHDMLLDSIHTYIEGNHLSAKGTTLGADDGIGVAFMLALMDDEEISHPPIEALFTSDEEDGMTGIRAITAEHIHGKRLINIDSEDEGVFYYGCAGGVSGDLSLPLEYEEVVDAYATINISVKGLLGGHSGVEINKARANAHKLLGRTIERILAESCLKIVSVAGGNKSNVITREASAVVVVPSENLSQVTEIILKAQNDFVHEYQGIDDGIVVLVSEVERAHVSLSYDTSKKIIQALLLLPDGVHSWHPTIEGLVGTSSNIGILTQSEDSVRIVVHIRSFFASKKYFLLDQVKAIAALVGAKLEVSSDYPDWEPNTNSKLMSLFDDTYQEIFHQKPVFMSIHAGLETGFMSKVFPDMDMISCGPTITGAHTTEETLHLDTTHKTIELLLYVLAKM